MVNRFGVFTPAAALGGGLAALAGASIFSLWSLPLEAASRPASQCASLVPCADPRGCPDLVVDPNIMSESIFLDERHFSPASCPVQEGEVGDSGRRRLLLFTSNTPNLGPGDLVIGDPADHPEWFDFQTCHGHPHFKEYADYRLWTPAGYAQWTALRARNKKACARDVFSEHPELLSQLVVGNKHGFCIVDLLPSAIPCKYPPDPFKYFVCESFTSAGVDYTGNQGISVCWADEYGTYLDGQWIDVTGVPPGGYVLEEEVNAEHFLQEVDYSNNSVAVTVTIP